MPSKNYEPKRSRTQLPLTLQEWKQGYKQGCSYYGAWIDRQEEDNDAGYHWIYWPGDYGQTHGSQLAQGRFSTSGSTGNWLAKGEGKGVNSEKKKQEGASNGKTKKRRATRVEGRRAARTEAGSESNE